MLRFTSSPTLKDQDVEQHLLLSTSVPIKIGSENAIKKEKEPQRKCGSRIRYTFGLRAMKSNSLDSSPSHSADHETHSNNTPQQHNNDEPKSKLVDNLSKTNSKLVKQTTIDYYV